MSNIEGRREDFGCLLEKSKDNWEFGFSLWKEQHKPSGDHKLDVAVNRLYYGMYESVKAYSMITAFQAKFGERSHTTMLRLVGVLFKEQKTSDGRRFRDVFNEMKALREQADYEETHVSPSKISNSLIDACKVLREKFEQKALQERNRRN